MVKIAKINKLKKIKAIARISGITKNKAKQEKSSITTNIDEQELLKNDSAKEVLIGTILKNARENININLQEASEYLKVRASDIKTLENNDIERIAKNIYIPGLIKSYGKFLKIDDKIIEEKLRDLSLRSNIEIKKHILVNVGETRKLKPSKDILIHSIIIFLILFIITLILFFTLENNAHLINTDIITNDILKIDD